jgi:hypothetical protein
MIMEPSAIGMGIILETFHLFTPNVIAMIFIFYFFKKLLQKENHTFIIPIIKSDDNWIKL